MAVAVTARRERRMGRRIVVLCVQLVVLVWFGWREGGEVGIRWNLGYTVGEEANGGRPVGRY